MSQWSDDDLRDDEFPDDWDDSDDAETVPCPECGTEVYEDAPRCPACGHYITSHSSPLQNWSWGWIVLGVLGTVATIFALVFFG